MKEVIRHKYRVTEIEVEDLLASTITRNTIKLTTPQTRACLLAAARRICMLASAPAAIA
jgi:hypothetical protein